MNQVSQGGYFTHETGGLIHQATSNLEAFVPSSFLLLVVMASNLLANSSTYIVAMQWAKLCHYL